MNPKSFITLLFISTAVSATVPPTEPDASHLVQRDPEDYQRCYRNCKDRVAPRMRTAEFKARCRRFCLAVTH
ncbi:uncharacterized protein LY79DRAFT_569294 [Colletotrichum navitas]|uniref:Uncharacterized protein n=1 Tax=Colletotrichum navitas TaxID=681940 RepID=A0AAD8PNB9_9PEZI|nr:uncharacterized protein LY79DRAFT_569294 [Colletotrichum navitas]KAK1572958.1 hypothetical protein LY79DRAFT_569294 [Colletotrichum navitas]